MYVKSLIWEKMDPPMRGWIADADIGVYRVFETGRDMWIWKHRTTWPQPSAVLSSSGDLISECFESAEAAKSDAEIAFRDRIMGCLHPSLTLKEASSVLLEDLQAEWPRIDWPAIWKVMQDDMQNKDAPAAFSEALQAIGVLFLKGRASKGAEAIQAMNENREFPTNTCGTSRHAQMIAEALIKGDNYPMLQEEPEYCGESIAHCVAELWRLRSEACFKDDLGNLDGEQPEI